MCISCSKEPSLQRYFVDSSEDAAFQSISFSPQNFIKNDTNLSKEEKEDLKNVSKLNVLLFQNTQDKEVYASEIQKVNSILAHERYQSLLSAGQPNQRVEVLYEGKDKQIKEIILFAQDEKMGFVLARILGKNLNPNNLYKIIQMGDKLDLSEITNTLEQFVGEL